MCGFSWLIKVLQFAQSNKCQNDTPSFFPSFHSLQYLFHLVVPADMTQRPNKMKIHETKIIIIKKGQSYMTDLNQNTNPPILPQEMQFSLHLTIPTIYRRPASLLLVLCVFLFIWCWRVIKGLPVAGHLHPYQELISALVLAAALIHPQCPGCRSWG